MGRLDIRSPLTVAGTAQFEALRLSLRSRSTLSGTGASLKRDSNEVSPQSFLNRFDEVKNRVRTRARVPNSVPIFDGDEHKPLSGPQTYAVRLAEKSKTYFVEALAVLPNTASTPAWAHFSPSPLETPIEPMT